MESDNTKLLQKIYDMNEKNQEQMSDIKVEIGNIKTEMQKGITLRLDNMQCEIDSNTKFKNGVMTTVGLAVLGALIGLVLV